MARRSRLSESDLAFPVFARIRDFEGKNLGWFQPKLMQRYHELACEDRLFATLRWVKVLSSLAEVKSGEGTFTLKRGGFLKPYVSVRDSDLDTEVALMNMDLISGGRISFTDGCELTFTSLRFWSFEWDFKDESGRLLFSIRKRSSLKNCGDVVISPNSKRDKHLMVAIAAAWYAIVLASEEAAVVVAGI